MAQKFKTGVIDLKGGEPNKDSIPAMLMPGESVITKDTTKIFKNELIMMEKNPKLMQDVFDIAKSVVSMPSMPMPEINMPELPSIAMPSINMPEMQSITIPDIPQIAMPEIPSINMPELNKTQMTMQPNNKELIDEIKDLKMTIAINSTPKDEIEKAVIDVLDRKFQQVGNSDFYRYMQNAIETETGKAAQI